MESPDVLSVCCLKNRLHSTRNQLSVRVYSDVTTVKFDDGTIMTFNDVTTVQFDDVLQQGAGVCRISRWV